ncbi:hypothetical protein [Enterococcus faecalis]|uniref:hypothetical protein n=1 Tax=Enterococcus TaxID=1350 RepID=UPI000330FC96|nr:hypothetical protein [Enterococcus faecalis]EOJ79208.1 hypothetical protein WOA_02079 [Enterococcus faecalis EnGen0356]MDK0526611.1 hypothetical protein [Enterococcus faecalis]RBR82783.1 hypothetical protein EB53_00651 [Enterococcus faecalis]WHK55344.1 hypothetical protein QLQ38_08130 [Enterococcus faecalis]
MATRKNLGDPWVLEVQQWLNKTFGSNPNYGSVAETGQTGWGIQSMESFEQFS